jgi:hypothetical protein
MMISRLFTAALATGFALASFSSCSNDPTLANNGVVTFNQIDSVGRPGINTLFVPFLSHDANDRGSPAGLTATLRTQIITFMTGPQTALSPANRATPIANAVAALLSTNVLIANVNQMGLPAGYLGVETQGTIGTKFGGRALTDDALATNLSLAFGAAATTFPANSYPFQISAASPMPVDDGNEQDGRAGRPQLTNDHVTPPPPSPVPTGTPIFPYLYPAI